MVKLRNQYFRLPSSSVRSQPNESKTQCLTSFLRLLHTDSEVKQHKRTVIFSGIQPTGVPHLGNYLGALKRWVELQNEASDDTKLFFSIVDLHSLTSHASPAERKQHRKSLLAAFLAVGLCPKKSTLFYQSSVPAHAELHWILSCDASMGWLSRMTQWKSKLSDQEALTLVKNTGPHNGGERTKLGLFSYPVLQAADILLYQTTHVPVGEDQLQHIEFSRECAQRFNFVYGAGNEVLTQPLPVLSTVKRVMSLQDPQKKMSKSHESPKSRILLTDTTEEIAKKFRVALTDSSHGISYDRIQRPGVSNILEIISHFDRNYQSPEDVAEDLKQSSLQALKERAAHLVSNHLAPIRHEYQRLLGSSDSFELANVAEEGRAKAIVHANKTIDVVREAVGI